jgi:multidrug resistance efflux pump
MFFRPFRNFFHTTGLSGLTIRKNLIRMASSAPEGAIPPPASTDADAAAAAAKAQKNKEKNEAARQAKLAKFEAKKAAAAATAAAAKSKDGGKPVRTHIPLLRMRSC